MQRTCFDLHNEPIPRRVTTGLSKIALALRTHAWQGAVPRGLTPTQGQILSLLRLRGGPHRLSELAHELGTTKATASDAVAALVEKKLVRKAPSPSDGR